MALRAAGFPADLALVFSADGDETFMSAVEQIHATQAVVDNPRFMQAVTWQNPRLVSEWLGKYTVSAELRCKPSRAKNKVAAITRYVQRYAMKNDTVGFFGPVGWGTLDGTADGLVTQSGDNTELRRTIRFEPWVIDTLARRWERVPEVRTQLHPRTVASVHHRDGKLARPFAPTVRLALPESAILALCDGSQTPIEIAATLAMDLDSTLASLERLVEAEFISWGFDIDYGDTMEHDLQAALERLPAGAAQRRCLTDLAFLSSRKSALEQTSSNTALRGAMSALVDGFASISGGEQASPDKSTRFDGRNLVYMDSLADWTATVGRDGLDALQAPLTMVLDVCRWIAWNLADGIHSRATHLISSHGGTLRFDYLLELIRPETTAKAGCVLDDVVRRLQARIDQLIPRGTDQSRIHLTSTDLTPTWEATFSAPAPPWPAGRIHNPDVMLSRSTANDTGATDALWVLGEVHVAFNSLEARVFADHQHVPGTVESLIDASVRDTRYIPAFSRTWDRLTPRTYPTPVHHVIGRDIAWTAWSDDLLPANYPRMRAVDLHVHLEKGRAVVRTEDGQIVAPLVELIGELISLVAINAFQPFRPLDHSPRITIDKLVLKRESWRFNPTDILAQLSAKNSFDGLRKCLRELGAPRFFFTKCTTEPKPLFCDLRSEPLVRTLFRVFTKAAAAGVYVTVEEMLPAFDGLWLSDSNGRRYTSEFRVIAVDSTAP